MHYTGTIYRPPFEAQSLLIQVTTGCSHNQCVFCTMYKGIPYHEEPLSQIEEDLIEASYYASQINRVFLVNGDAFTLKAERLIEIADLIHHYLPNVDTIAMYASIRNIRSKTDEELRQLRACGIDDLNIGVESGLDSALRYLNKGYTAQEADMQLQRLRAAGFHFGLNIILGATNVENSIDHAVATAELINKAQPNILFTGTLHAAPGCPLYDDIQSGKFKELTYRQYIEEERCLISHLQLNDCFYFGLHPANVVRLQGWLSEDKEQLLNALDQAEQSFSEEKLDSIPKRYGGEGAIID